MFENKKTMTVHTRIEYVWDFLLVYQWSDLLSGEKVLKESPTTWSVHNGKDDKRNIQDIEADYRKEQYLVNIKITPRHNKHHSYDELQVKLNESQHNTTVTLTYSYHPKSITERIFAVILEREDTLLTDFATELFDALNIYLLERVYG